MSRVRVRQVALVARELEPVLVHLNDVFSLKVGFRDPRDGGFGLVNAVLPIGGDFLEVVQPVREDVSAARYLMRRGGDAGYMMILQSADALADRRKLGDLGVRFVAEGSHEGYTYTHFHPVDCGGVLSATYTVDNDASWLEPSSDWPPAGRNWREALSTQTLGVAAVEIQCHDRNAVAARWSQLFDAPLVGVAELKFSNCVVRFVDASPADGTGITGLDLKVVGADACLRAARGKGLPEKDGAIFIGGVWMRPIETC